VWCEGVDGTGGWFESIYLPSTSLSTPLMHPQPTPKQTNKQQQVQGQELIELVAKWRGEEIDVGPLPGHCTVHTVKVRRGCGGWRKGIAYWGVVLCGVHPCIANPRTKPPQTQTHTTHQHIT
jgi:hypothetical protein